MACLVTPIASASRRAPPAAATAVLTPALRASSNSFTMSRTIVVDSYTFLSLGQQGLHNGRMSNLLGNALRSARVSKGITQQQIADRLGITRAAITQWEKGVTEPSLENLMKACNMLGLDVAAATSGMVQVQTLPALSGDGTFTALSDRRPEGRDFHAEIVNRVSRRNENEPDLAEVPILSAGVDYARPDEFLIYGEIIDFVARPTGIARAKDAYAMYVVTPAMAPRYEVGEVLYFQPARPVGPGDDVLIELVSDEERQGGRRAVLRRLLEVGEKVLVRQFSPAHDHSIPRSAIKAIHRVIPWRELIA